jgi:hypothetical protein
MHANVSAETRWRDRWDGAALLSAGLGDGAHGRDLVDLPAQVVFLESRDREKRF